jgi:hypothetical protein
MVEEHPLQRHRRSLGEEIANSVSREVRLLATPAPLLVLAGARQGGAATVVGASVFAAARVVLYLTSTLHHALPQSQAKRSFYDHGTAYLVIGCLVIVAARPLWLVRAGIGPVLAAGRQHRIHRGGGVLRRQTPAVLPSRVAPVRACRYRAPLRRGVAVRRLMVGERG